MIIAIALISVIMTAVMSLFMVGIKNYQRESQRNFMQKEINFTADDIGSQIKQAAEAPNTFDSFTRDAQTLILTIPAVDTNDNFIYSGNFLIYDSVIFYRDGNQLKKKLVPDSLSVRTAKDNPVLADVTNFSCDYAPPAETDLVSCTIETSRQVSNVTLNFSAVKTARMRNHR